MGKYFSLTTCTFFLTLNTNILETNQTQSRMYLKTSMLPFEKRNLWRNFLILLTFYFRNVQIPKRSYFVNVSDPKLSLRINGATPIQHGWDWTYLTIISVCINPAYYIFNEWEIRFQMGKFRLKEKFRLVYFH